MPSPKATGKKRRKLFEPAYAHHALDLNERDRQVLELVYHYRLLSTPQIQALLPDCPPETLSKRLTELFHHNYLSRPPRQMALKIVGEEPWAMIYAPTPKGLKALAIETNTRFDTKNKKLSDHFMRHRLGTNNFRITLTLALKQQPHLRLVFWLPDKTWHETVEVKTGHGSESVKLWPDGFFALHDEPRHRIAYFFTEWDTGSEIHDRLIKKLYLYTLLLSQKELTPPLFPNERIKGFRVLITLNSKERQQNLLIKGQGLPKPGMFYTTTRDQIDLAQPDKLLAPIWTTLKGEQKAIVE